MLLREPPIVRHYLPSKKIHGWLLRRNVFSALSIWPRATPAGALPIFARNASASAIAGRPDKAVVSMAEGSGLACTAFHARSRLASVTGFVPSSSASLTEFAESECEMRDVVGGVYPLTRAYRLGGLPTGSPFPKRDVGLSGFGQFAPTGA